MVPSRFCRALGPAMATVLWLLSPSRGLSAQTVSSELPDDQWAALAERVPGFAGWWQDGDTTVLMLVDTTRRAAALKAIAMERGRRLRNPIRVQKADFDFKQLRDWKRLAPLGDTVFHMTMVDADEVHNRLSVAVADSVYLASARQHLMDLGIPPRAIVMEVDFVRTR